MPTDRGESPGRSLIVNWRVRFRAQRLAGFAILCAFAVWLIAILLAIVVNPGPGEAVQRSCTWPGVGNLPQTSLVTDVSWRFGVRRSSMRVSTHRYNEAGTLQYWQGDKWIDAVDLPSFEPQDWDIEWVAVGIPFSALHGGTFEVTTHYISGLKRSGTFPGAFHVDERSPQPRLVPLRPAWTGFLLNVIVYWVVLVGSIEITILIRSIVRRSKNCCVSCGYPIGHSPVCTECSAPVAASATAPQPRRGGGK